MIIHGREIKFKRTIGAVCMIAENCKDKNIDNLASFLNNGTTTEVLLARASFIAALSNGYDDQQSFENPNYERINLQIEEILALDEEPMAKLFNEAVSAWMGEKPSIEVEEPKKKAKRKAVTSD